jgi:glycosyltransferase involved in cell wall biosynthesis
MQKQKILILSWEIYPNYCGGLGVLVKHLVNELKDQGHNVDILIPDAKVAIEDKNIINLNSRVEYYLDTKNEIPNLDFKLKNFRSSSHKEPDQRVSRIYPKNTPAVTSAYAFAVQEYLIDKQYDMILGMDWLTIPTFCLLRESNPTPFAFYINGTEIDRNYGAKMSKTSFAIHNLEKKFYNQAELIFTVSSVCKTVLIKHLKCKGSKIKVIHNDSEVKTIMSEKELRNPKRILFLGRLAYQKGLKYLLQSFRKLTKLDDNVELVIVGDGEQKKYINKYIEYHKLHNKVKLIPWLEGEHKTNIYLTAKVFMMPSVSEPFGLTALEAIRHGLPILASTRCGFCDIIPSTPTYEFTDTKHQSLLMNKYLNDEDQWQTLIGLQKAELSVHNWADQIRKIISFI